MNNLVPIPEQKSSQIRQYNGKRPEFQIKQWDESAGLLNFRASLVWVWSLSTCTGLRSSRYVGRYLEKSKTSLYWPPFNTQYKSLSKSFKYPEMF